MTYIIDEITMGAYVLELTIFPMAFSSLLSLSIW